MGAKDNKTTISEDSALKLGDPEATDTPETLEDQGAGEIEKKDKEPSSDWRDRELAKKHKQIQDRTQKLQAAETELEKLRRENAELTARTNQTDRGNQDQRKPEDQSRDPIRSAFRTQEEFDQAESRRLPRLGRRTTAGQSSPRLLISSI